MIHDVAGRPRFGTPQEVAEYRRTTVRALTQERYLGAGPKYIKDGRRVLYEWAAVDAYMESRTQVSTREAA
jgi:hypothetical protein